MSGFYLLIVMALWLFIGWIIYRLWRCWKPTVLNKKIIHIVITVLFFSIWFGVAFWEVTGKKMYWDAKVRKLCAIDGGVKVYETVELTPDLLDKFGRIRIPFESKVCPTDLYLREMDVENLGYKNPKLTRTKHMIIRRSDGKLLGESISYGRGGGDLPGPWEGSYFLCPDPSHRVGLSNSIFVKRSGK